MKQVADSLFHELIYAGKDIEDICKSKYPDAVITDASDYIHTERFEFDANTTEEEFYPLAIKEGFAMCCLGFALLYESLRFPETKTMKPKENFAKIQHWIELAKSDVHNTQGEKP
jgi:hypothetical protein